jgi:hypothetical protein
MLCFIKLRSKTFLITLLILLTFSNASAQLGRGCLVDGLLYTSNTSRGNRFFYRTVGGLSTTCEFVQTGSNVGNCRLYNGGNEADNTSYTLYTDAFSNDWEEVTPCPLDNHFYMLLIFIFGIFSIKLKFSSLQQKQINL